MAQTAIRRPRVFVSSTIADLRDLRSALRFWLERAGFDVQLSEYNDFDRLPDSDAFESCLANVASADHYILLIGGRRGGWYDESKRVSITQQEFRTAAEAERARSIGISVFIRSDTHIAIQQWRESKGKKARSRFLDDPAFISELAEEVSQPPDGATASRWRYTFSDFRDIVDALQVLLKIETTFEKRLLEQNVLDEMISNISTMVGKGKETSPMLAHHHYALSTGERAKISIPSESIGGGTIEITNKQARQLSFMLMSGPRGGGLKRRVLDEAIRRGLFREYEPALRRLVTTVEHEALRALLDDIESFSMRQETEYYRQAVRKLFVVGNEARRSKQAEFTVDADDVTLLLGVWDRLEDVYNGLVSFSKWILGSAESPEIERAPASPVEGMSEDIEAEIPSADEVLWALEKEIHPFGPNLVKASRKIAERTEKSWVQRLRSMSLGRFSDEKIEEAVKKSFDESVVAEYEPPPKISRRVRR